MLTAAMSDLMTETTTAEVAAATDAALARSALPGVYVPDAAVLGAMCRWAERAGWDGIAAELRSHPLCLEQEALPAELPHVPHAP